MHRQHLHGRAVPPEVSTPTGATNMGTAQDDVIQRVPNTDRRFCAEADATQVMMGMM